MQNHAPTIYAYKSIDDLVAAEIFGGNKSPLPDISGKVVTERPDQK